MAAKAHPLVRGSRSRRRQQYVCVVAGLSLGLFLIWEQPNQKHATELASMIGGRAQQKPNATILPATLPSATKASKLNEFTTPSPTMKLPTMAPNLHHSPTSQEETVGPTTTPSSLTPPTIPFLKSPMYHSTNASLDVGSLANLTQLVASFAVCPTNEIVPPYTLDSNDTWPIHGVKCGNNDDDAPYSAFAKLLWQYVIQSHNNEYSWAFPRNTHVLDALTSEKHEQNWLLVGTYQLLSVALTMVCQLTRPTPASSLSTSSYAVHWEISSMEFPDRWTKRLVLTRRVESGYKGSEHANDIEKDGKRSITLWMIVHPYALYSSKYWDTLLETHFQLKQDAHRALTINSLSEMDAIVVGTLNACTNNDTTPFSKRMKQYEKRAIQQYGPNTSLNLTDLVHDLDCFTIAPPSVASWRQRYNGPLLFLTDSPASHSDAARLIYHQAREYKTQVRSSTSWSSLRTDPLGVLPADYHFNQIVIQRPVLLSDPIPLKATLKAGGGRISKPCIGRFGGYLDLMAWEVLSFLVHARNDTNNDFEPPPQRHWHVPPYNRTDYHPNATTATMHWCQKPIIAAPRDDKYSLVLPATFQCEGPRYDNFTKLLHQYVLGDDTLTSNATYYTIDRTYWGKRVWPIPANRKVLMFGNSHTRQVTESLMCMHNHNEVLEEIIRTGTYTAHYKLANNATLVVVINSHVPYSFDWVNLLQQETGVPLDAFDAVVLGQMNPCDLPDTLFSTQMQKVSEEVDGVDCLRIPPPSIPLWTRHYEGPLIFLPMMSPGRNTLKETILTDLEAMRQKYPDRYFSSVNARQHIEAIGLECVGVNRTGISDCWEQHEFKAGMQGIVTTHRCQGAHGGHADLVAWDLVEKLYSILK